MMMRQRAKVLPYQRLHLASKLHCWGSHCSGTRLAHERWKSGLPVGACPCKSLDRALRCKNAYKCTGLQSWCIMLASCEKVISCLLNCKF